MKTLSPKIYIIILNWNNIKDTTECLESVRKINYSNYKVVIVDNGSTDGSPEKIRMLSPEITLIKNKQNMGYAGGNNIGIKYALENGADHILLLNNDTIVDPEILSSFVWAADAYPDAGIFGGKVYYYSKPTVIWFTAGKWDKGKGKFHHIGEDCSDRADSYGDVAETDFICGCALFFRKKVAETIGLLEPKYFLMFEETDWCYRARKEGFKSIYVPSAKIWHKVSKSFNGGNSPLYSYFFTRNRLLWAKRNLSMSEKWRVYVAVVKEFFPNIFFLTQTTLLKRLYWDMARIVKNYKTPQFKAKVFGLWDFALSRFGDCPWDLS